MIRPIVAIVGRTNVGKSTLFNRLIRQRKAIVDDRPGITRDRVYAECDWNGKEFILVDTGGLAPGGTEVFDELVTQQVYLAIDEAEVVLFLVDTRVGVQSTDEDIASILKKGHKKVIVAANKADSEHHLPDSIEFYKLGLGEVIPVSAAGGRNIAELLDAVSAKLPVMPDEPGDRDELRLAIVGRPNVGKSSLFNAILGENRQIVSEIPGTTRDSVDSVVEVDDKRYRFIDTAGLRRKSRYPDIIEYYSSLRSLKAIERSDIAMVLIDSNQGITSGDVRIAGDAVDLGRGLIFIANKWDLVKGVQQHDFVNEIYEKAQLLRFSDVVFTNALNGKGFDKMFVAIDELGGQLNRRIATAELNKFLEESVLEKHPPARQGKHIKFYYATQVYQKPPRIVIFSNFPQLVDTSYKRYLENRFRDKFGFRGVPINFSFRPRNKE